MKRFDLLPPIPLRLPPFLKTPIGRLVGMTVLLVALTFYSWLTPDPPATPRTVPAAAKTPPVRENLAPALALHAPESIESTLASYDASIRRLEIFHALAEASLDTMSADTPTHARARALITLTEAEIADLRQARARALKRLRTQPDGMP